MIDKSYHHGDLHNALIEAGIELISENGIQQFSLRKVAAICNVSHTAPYAHFKDVDSLLQAMSEHVAIQFVETLRAAMEGQEICDGILTELGKAYVAFFIDHPNYYQFLFHHSGVVINLDDEQSNDYPPFAFFRDIAFRLFDKHGLPLAVKKQLLITKWAQVHGMAALVTNKNVKYSGDWKTVMENIPTLKG